MIQIQSTTPSATKGFRARDKRSEVTFKIGRARVESVAHGLVDLI